jgi:hypothetical protein
MLLSVERPQAGSRVAQPDTFPQLSRRAWHTRAVVLMESPDCRCGVYESWTTHPLRWEVIP